MPTRMWTEKNEKMFCWRWSTPATTTIIMVCGSAPLPTMHSGNEKRERNIITSAFISITIEKKGEDWRRRRWCSLQKECLLRWERKERRLQPPSQLTQTPDQTHTNNKTSSNLLPGHSAKRLSRGHPTTPYHFPFFLLQLNYWQHLWRK